jgi:hypothetical protein
MLEAYEIDDDALFEWWRNRLPRWAPRSAS